MHVPIEEAASIIIEEDGSHATAAYLVFPDGSRHRLLPGAGGT
jgi:hypothetical protein